MSEVGDDRDGDCASKNKNVSNVNTHASNKDNGALIVFYTPATISMDS